MYCKVYVKLALAYIILLFFCPASIGAEKNPDIRDGAVQVDGHWIGLNWPLSGAGIRSSAYGMRIDPFLGIVKAHGGLDIAVPFGTNVLAALGGRVIKTGNDRELGNFVIILHSEARETIYGHLSEIMAKEGQFVNARQIIGKVGSSGRSTGAHLHFAVRRNGKLVDPQKWMVPTGLMK